MQFYVQIQAPLLKSISGKARKLSSVSSSTDVTKDEIR